MNIYNINTFTKYTFLLLFVLLNNSNLISSNLTENEHEIFRALRDEIKITLNQLKLETLQPAYYVEYEITVSEPISLKSVGGKFVSKSENKTITLNVGLRLGSYKFDNSNFFDVGLSFFGSSDDEERFKRRNLPLELNYNTLRRELWLATDAAYKQNSEIFTKKISSLKNRMRKDTLQDFLEVKVHKFYESENFPILDEAYFIKVLNTTSEIFLNYPEIFSNSSNLEFSRKTKYYVNSEGIEYKKTETYTGIEIVGYCQSEDGMPISDFYSSYSSSPNSLPNLDSLKNATVKIADNIRNLTKVKIIEDSYSGPVIFSELASCELIAQIFAPNLITQRPLMTETGTQELDRNASFQNKIGARVLPEFISVEDSPEIQKLNNTNLIVSFDFDEDGQKAEKLTIVENGYLQNLISGRTPTKKINQTTNRVRGGSPIYSNLIFKPNLKSKNTISDNDLKKKLIEICKKRKLDFGIIVKKIHNQNIYGTTLYSISMGGLDFIRGEGSFSIIEMYKVNLDGTEELIRGLKGSNFIPQNFKDILFIGNKSISYNLLTPSVISNFISGGDQYLTASITSPSLLFEDVDLKLIETDFKKPPILTNPISK